MLIRMFLVSSFWVLARASIDWGTADPDTQWYMTVRAPVLPPSSR